MGRKRRMSEAQARRDFALEVVLRLRGAGFQALWAGGCVRDLLLGLVPVDYDVATDATPDQVMLSLPFRAITVGISFGVVRVRHPRMQRIEVEVEHFAATSPTWTAAGRLPWPSALRRSMPPAAILQSTVCLWIPSRAR
jgi:hypothetical protein